MALTAAEISFLQRLVTERRLTKAAGALSSAFVDEHRLGQRIGRSVVYTEGDLELARRLLRNAGQSEAPLAKGASRSDMAARVGVSEKSGASRPHANSIAWKTAAGSLKVDGATAPVFDGGYHVSTVEHCCQVQADILMVVENLESMRWLAKARWIDYSGLNVLAIYRGDVQFSNADVKRLLEQRSEEVWVFSDFDPAGLGIAASVPRLSRLVLPALEVLEALTVRAQRFDLYAGQLDQYGRALDTCAHHEIEQAWKLMKRLQAGLPQEWMGSEEQR